METAKRVFEALTSRFSSKKMGETVENFFNVEEEEVDDEKINFDDMEKVIDLDCIKCDTDGSSPLDELAKTMTNVDPDGKIKKLLVEEGTVQVINGAYVVFHYNFYFDLNEIPFDSTYLREGPETVTLGTNSLLPGLEMALLTMKKGEKSKFVVHYDLAYGERGNPPRIPPKSNVLMVIDVMKVFNFGEVNSINVNDTEKMFRKVSTYCDIAKDSFMMKMYTTALDHYKKARSTLVEMPDKKCEQWKELFFKVALNSMVCHNKTRKKNPKQVKEIAQEAMQVADDFVRKSSKFFYQLGLAHQELGVTEQALKCFKRAQELNSTDKLIRKALLQEQKQMKAAKTFESEFSARALGLKEPIRYYSDEDETQKLLRKQIEKFAASDLVSLKLPVGLTPNELRFIEKLSDNFKIHFKKHNESYLVTKTL